MGFQPWVWNQVESISLRSNTACTTRSSGGLLVLMAKARSIQYKHDSSNEPFSVLPSNGGSSLIGGLVIHLQHAGAYLLHHQCSHITAVIKHPAFLCLLHYVFLLQPTLHVVRLVKAGTSQQPAVSPITKHSATPITFNEHLGLRRKKSMVQHVLLHLAHIILMLKLHF